MLFLSFLSSLEITAVASAIDAGIQKKINGLGTAILLNSKENVLKLLKILKYYWKELLKQLKWGFLSVLLGTLGASLLRNLLSGNGIVTAGNYQNEPRINGVSGRNNLPKT